MNFKAFEQIVGVTSNKITNYDEYLKNIDKYKKECLKNLETANTKISEKVSGLKEIKVLLENRHLEKTINGEKYIFTTLSKNEQAEKTKIQNTLFSSYGDYVLENLTFVNCHENVYSQIKSKTLKSDNVTVDRDVINLFKPNKYMEKDGDKALNDLLNASTSEQKKEIVETYFNKLMDVFDEHQPRYLNDKDLAENCKEYLEISQMFLADPSVLVSMERSFGITLNEETKKRYTDHLEYAQQNYQFLRTKVSYMLEKSYTLFPEETIKNINAYVSDELLEYQVSFAELNSKEERPLISGGELIGQLERNQMGGQAFSFYKMANKFNENTQYIGPNGIMKEEEASKLIAEGKRVEAVNSDGKIFKMQTDRNGFAKNENEIINNVDLNNKEDVKNIQNKFKEALVSLNSGTSIFNVSSKEYKEMRNILAGLSKEVTDKKGYIDKINEFKQLGKKYLENHDKKEKISDTALKRKNCVLDALSKIDELNGAFDIDPEAEKKFISKINAENTERAKEKIDVLDPKKAVENFEEYSKEKQQEMIRASKGLESQRQKTVVKQKQEIRVKEKTLE